MSAELFLTDLGNAFVATVIALVVMAWLWNRVGWLMSLVFGVCFGGVWLSVTALKIVARDFAKPPQVAGLFELSQGAPSGHIALAATVFGCAAAVFLMLDRRPLGLLGAAFSLSALTIVAVTRVTLHLHTISDVLAGLAVAAIGVTIFSAALKAQTRDRSTEAGGLLLAMTAAAVVALISGLRVSSVSFL
jgi:undecaprenyl-diphosphatase